jgi:signal transduction histidine kinase
MGDLAAGVAHEIRNPLNAIGIAAQRLHREFVPKADVEEFTELSSNILNETTRLSEILSRFLALARSHVQDSDVIDIAALLRQTISNMRSEAEARSIHIMLSIPESMEARGNGEKYQQVFVNILKNGMEAIGREGEITISAEEDKNGINIIRFEDTGPGFKDDSLSKIFQPYYTTKTDGSGLGLALSYRIITDYGGKLLAENRPGGGARLSIILPKA